MDRVEDICFAIDRLYAAALGDDEWQAALAAITALIPGEHVIVQAQYGDERNGHFFTAAGLGERELAHLMAMREASIADPLVGRMPVGTAVRSSSLICDYEWER